MGLQNFNRVSRAAHLAELGAGARDLLVIGGGITGASIFRDAALRGLRVALVEAGDFASGTSSRSSKLIHGGLRYLKNLGVRMAWESCHERNLHIRLNKRLVRPVPFLIPIYRGQGESRGRLRLGMALYEAVSGFGNQRFHRFLSREETLLLAPGLPAHELEGGCIYYDALVNDGRWTMETIKDGVRAGGLALNYCPATSLVMENGGIAGATVHDRLSGEVQTVRARVVVNATGIFSDEVRAMAGSQPAPLVRLSKGTHLVFDEDDVPLSVTTVFTSPLDGRALFLIRRDGCFLYGTTDDWEGGDARCPAPAARDVEYLLESLARFMPNAGLDRERVRFVYSGFRPLAGGEGASGDASRAEQIEVHASGLITIAGGKLTTARLMAVRVLDRVLARLGSRQDWQPCHTHELSMGGTNEQVAEGLAYWAKRCPRLHAYFRTLYRRYGLDAHDICAEALRIFTGRHPDPAAEPIRAEVQYVCRHEMVCTVEDLIDRRAGFLYWDAAKRLERVRRAAHLIREELRIDDTEFQEQYEAYAQHLARLHSLPPASARHGEEDRAPRSEAE